MTITVSFSFANEAEAAAFLSAKGGKADADSSASTKTENKVPAKTATKVKTKTKAEVTTICNSVKESLGTAVAKALIKEFGKADKLAEVEDENLNALYAAAQEKLAEAETAEEDEDM